MVDILLADAGRAPVRLVAVARADDRDHVGVGGQSLAGDFDVSGVIDSASIEYPTLKTLGFVSVRGSRSGYRRTESSRKAVPTVRATSRTTRNNLKMGQALNSND